MLSFPQVILKTSIKFLISLFALTLLCTALWQHFITNTLYRCTDSLGLDYLHPGHWVHDPVSTAQIIPASSMSGPDTIKHGWNQTGRWALWFCFVGVSTFMSTQLARIRWISIRLPLAPNGANASSHG